MKEGPEPAGQAFAIVIVVSFSRFLCNQDSFVKIMTKPWRLLYLAYQYFNKTYQHRLGWNITRSKKNALVLFFKASNTLF